MNRLQTLFADSAAIAEDNIAFLEDLYERFLRDPGSVDSSWREKFISLQDEGPPFGHPRKRARMAPQESGQANEIALRKQAAVDQLIYHYRTRGHQVADNNPL